MKFLVTGAGGFVGQYVINNLIDRDIEIIAAFSSRKRFNRIPSHKNIEKIELNLLHPTPSNYNDLKGINGIIHLAWGGLPNYWDTSHITNELPLHKEFLSEIISLGCKNINIIGTCMEYGLLEGELNEEMHVNPITPYAIAKDDLRNFLEKLNIENQFYLKWQRLFYVYGKGQRKSSLFASLQSALDSGEPIFNMSNGSQIRDFLKIEEAASRIVKASLQINQTGIINICSGNPLRLFEIVRNYLKETNQEISLILGSKEIPDYEPYAFWGSTDKLNKIIK